MGKKVSSRLTYRSQYLEVDLGAHCSYCWILQFYTFISRCRSADVAIDVPDFLDLNRLRATGLQAGEEELPDLMPPIVLPEDTRGMK